ncbi:MAG: flagellar assembly protein H [Scytonema sp. PMC 1069.18]|nr:flagellar assembly protein H [Scytonema sp. PMC 1069.18]MEC4885550.1 flagellar assembly protein H [Scytonema sp. PMC 1070.18]
MNNTLFNQFAKQFFEAFLTPLGEVKLNLEVPAQPCVIQTLFVPFSESSTYSEILGNTSNEDETKSKNPEDQLSRQLLRGLLSQFGEFKTNVEIPTEPYYINIWFAPASQPPANPEALGVLNRIATTPCLIEPFCDELTEDDVQDCMAKLLRKQSQFQRQLNIEDEDALEEQLPKLWVLAPSVSEDVPDGFNATLSDEWFEGIYFLAPFLRSVIIAIDELPQIQETLLLRILGKGATQRQAIYEASALPKEDPRRSTILRLLATWKMGLKASAEIDREDRELLMILSDIPCEDV